MLELEQRLLATAKIPKKSVARRSTNPRRGTASASELRIIGGKYGGRKLAYSGRLETRPMKERVREATFNLVGPSIRGTHAIDLFAGTGAIGLEALSRGALSVTFVERHLPTLRGIRENILRLGVDEPTSVIRADTLVWTQQDPPLPELPWSIFCSPPYALYRVQLPAVLAMLDRWLNRAPAGSLLAVESDASFDFGQLPQAERWRVRSYAPAVVGLLRLDASP